MVSIGAVLYSACAAVFIANVYVCYRVWTSDYFEQRQKIIQCCLIWLLPAVGAAIAHTFTREPKISDTRAYPVDSSLGNMGDIGYGEGSGDYFDGGHHGS
jgi:hypothetical protein